MSSLYLYSHTGIIQVRHVFVDVFSSDAGRIQRYYIWSAFFMWRLEPHEKYLHDFIFLPIKCDNEKYNGLWWREDICDLGKVLSLMYKSNTRQTSINMAKLYPSVKITMWQAVYLRWKTIITNDCSCSEPVENRLTYMMFQVGWDVN